MMNPINESLYRAYTACESGRHADACEHLRDAADLAFLAGDMASYAGAVRAYGTVAALLGQRHLRAVP